MISAHTNPADLVARILRPLARSLEEARQHLALEDVDDAAADEESPPVPDAAPVRRLPPHGVAPLSQPTLASGRRTAPTAGIDRPGPPAAPLFRPQAPTAPAIAATPASSASSASATSGVAPSAQPPFSPAGIPPSASVAPPAADTARRAPPSAPTPASPPATAPTPGQFRTGTAPHQPEVTPQATPDAAPQSASPPAALGEPATLAPSPAAIRLVRADTHPNQPPVPPVTADAAASTAPTAFKAHHPAGTPPLAAVHPDAPAPAQAASTPSAPPPRHWRLRPAAAVEAAPPVVDDTRDTYATEAAALARPTAAPSLLPRNPALTRVMQAMDPVLDKAWQLTDAALPTSDDAPPAASDAPRVTNQFNVTVALGGEATDTVGRDPRQLEDALVALLRDAARRQGLDV